MNTLPSLQALSFTSFNNALASFPLLKVCLEKSDPVGLSLLFQGKKDEIKKHFTNQATSSLSGPRKARRQNSLDHKIVEFKTAWNEGSLKWEIVDFYCLQVAKQSLDQVSLENRRKINCLLAKQGASTILLRPETSLQELQYAIEDCGLAIDIQTPEGANFLSFFAYEKNAVKRDEKMAYLIKKDIAVNVHLKEKCCTPFSALIFQEYIESASQFIDLAGDRLAVNAVCAPKGKTALHLAAQGGFTSLALHLLDRYSNTIQINLADETGKTALHYACLNGDYQLTQALVEAGAYINYLDLNNRPPLYYACGPEEILAVSLGEMQIDPHRDYKASNNTITDSEGISLSVRSPAESEPIEIIANQAALQDTEIHQALLQAIDILNGPAPQRSEAQQKKFLADRNHLECCKTLFSGKSLLAHYATRRPAVISFLLEQGACVTLKIGEKLSELYVPQRDLVNRFLLLIAETLTEEAPKRLQEIIKHLRNPSRELCQKYRRDFFFTDLLAQHDLEGLQTLFSDTRAFMQYLFEKHCQLENSGQDLQFLEKLIGLRQHTRDFPACYRLSEADKSEIIEKYITIILKQSHTPFATLNALQLLLIKFLLDQGANFPNQADISDDKVTACLQQARFAQFLKDPTSACHATEPSGAIIHKKGWDNLKDVSLCFTITLLPEQSDNSLTRLRQRILAVEINAVPDSQKLDPHCLAILKDCIHEAVMCRKSLLIVNNTKMTDVGLLLHLLNNFYQERRNNPPQFLRDEEGPLRAVLEYLLALFPALIPQLEILAQRSEAQSAAQLLNQMPSSVVRCNNTFFRTSLPSIPEEFSREQAPAIRIHPSHLLALIKKRTEQRCNNLNSVTEPPSLAC
jgi:Ankyrin repeats (3 copies)